MSQRRYKQDPILASRRSHSLILELIPFASFLWLAQIARARCTGIRIGHSDIEEVSEFLVSTPNVGKVLLRHVRMAVGTQRRIPHGPNLIHTVHYETA